MKVVVSAKASATFLDGDEQPIMDAAILQKLDGATDGMGGIAEYLDEELQEIGLEGGAIELKFVPGKGLRVACTFVSPRSLDEDEMQALLDDVAGQWSDGAGENYDPEVASNLGIVIHLDQGDRRVELFDKKEKKVKEIGGDVPTKQLDPEEERFLQAVYSEPRSDEPRRAYAEWLTKKGDSRGEFIALQLKTASGSSLKKDDKRAASLLAKEWRSWVGPIADVMEFKSSQFKRGFLEHAFLTGDIRGKPRWSEIIGHPSLSTLSSIECFLPDENAVPFLSSPSLKNLQHVIIRSGTLEAVSGNAVAWRPESLRA